MKIAVIDNYRLKTCDDLEVIPKHDYFELKLDGKVYKTGLKLNSSINIKDYLISIYKDSRPFDLEEVFHWEEESLTDIETDISEVKKVRESHKVNELNLDEIRDRINKKEVCKEVKDTEISNFLKSDIKENIVNRESKDIKLEEEEVVPISEDFIDNVEKNLMGDINEKTLDSVSGFVFADEEDIDYMEKFNAFKNKLSSVSNTIKTKKDSISKFGAKNILKLLTSN